MAPTNTVNRSSVVRRMASRRKPCPQADEPGAIEPSREPYEAERREARLVRDFRDHLAKLGHTASRHRVLPRGEASPLYTDLYVAGLDLLVEAKGTVERNAVRLAVGQLLDYRRYVKARRWAVLLPSEPRPDLVEFVVSLGLELFWQDGKCFRHVA